MQIQNATRRSLPFLLMTHLMAFSLAFSATSNPKAEVVHAEVINDEIPNAMLPMGVAKVGPRSLIAVFCDGIDFMPGTKSYLVRSDDLGKTWGKPYMEFAPEEKNIGIAAGLSRLPNGDILLVKTTETYLSGDLSWDAVFKARTSHYPLMISSDGGKTFSDAGELPVPERSAGGVMSQVVALPNGDLILAGFQYQGGFPAEAGFQYGSGFFRSKDGGKTWGPLEVAFQDPVPGRDQLLAFSEAAYVVRPDGMIIGYARIDSEKLEGDDAKQWQSRGNNMWRVESRDNGQTWSTPVETNIGGLFPAIARLGEDKYLLVCGNRHAEPTRKVCLYTSRDGLDFQPAGFAPYQRTGGQCVSSATGGSQALSVLSDKEAYMVYFAADPQLPGEYHTYIEGCLLRVK